MCSTNHKIPLIVISALVFMVATCYAGCGVPKPKTTLVELHPGCNAAYKTRYPVCVAAMHRYCQRTSYPGKRYPIGITREHTYKVVSMSCIEATWAGNVKVTELRRFHSYCRLSKSQHRDCLSAIHRYCENRFGAKYAGISQEVGVDGFFVGCFKSGYKANVPPSKLTLLHHGCKFPFSDGAQCFSAASRFCRKKGFSGGVTQEVNKKIMTVACYNGKVNPNVPIK